MPRKNSNVSHNAFLGKLAENSKTATSEVSQVLKRTGQKDDQKGIEYIDIRLMEDAPEGWNLYPRLKDSQPEKHLELKMSIYHKGVQEPITLWQRDGDTYMILAGHNRRSICEEIIEECREEEGFDERKFRFPPCIVYKKDELTEEAAREIIDDTNLYRDFSKLPNRVKIAITRHRLQVYADRRYAKGARIDQLAKELGLKKTAVYENLAIAEQVIEPLQELYYNETLTRKAVIKFTMFDKDTQEWILKEFGDQLTDARVKALKQNMSRKEISEIFAAGEKVMKKIMIEIPSDREDEFREMFGKWLSQKKEK